MVVRRSLLALFLLAAAGHLLVSAQVWEGRWQARRSTQAGFVLPSKFSRILAVGYKGLLSDFQMLKTITFYGERVVLQEQLSEDDVLYIVAGLDAVTDLDPYFLDPYIFTEGVLAWDAGNLDEANRILSRGMEARPEDWQIPFFIGFNYFYFLGDNATGAEYLMRASRLPGAPDFLSPLAARLGYYGGKAKTAIMFLQGILAQTSDEGLRTRLSLRLLALKRADAIEEGLEAFKLGEGRMPVALPELVAKGYLETLPLDPYGGQWVILENGRVFSSSRFVEQGQGTK